MGTDTGEADGLRGMNMKGNLDGHGANILNNCEDAFAKTVGGTVHEIINRRIHTFASRAFNA